MIKSFTIAGIKHTIEYVEKIDDGCTYGRFYEPTKKILIAKRIYIDNNWYDIPKDLQQNTLYHELAHVFQYYTAQDYNEKDAQVFANFMCEFINSKVEEDLY